MTSAADVSTDRVVRRPFQHVRRRDWPVNQLKFVIRIRVDCLCEGARSQYYLSGCDRKVVLIIHAVLVCLASTRA